GVVRFVRQSYFRQSRKSPSSFDHEIMSNSLHDRDFRVKLGESGGIEALSRNHASAKGEWMGKKVLVLRTSHADGTSYNGFRWPREGPVEAPDFRPEPQCGHGLHGLLWGVGCGSYLGSNPDSIWQVVAVEEETLIDLGDKVKFPRGEVVHTGNQISATDYLLANGAAGLPVTGATATAGDRGTATAGDCGTATARRYGTATAGRYGTATAGYAGT